MDYGLLACLICYGIFSWLLGFFAGRNSKANVGTPSTSNNSRVTHIATSKPCICGGTLLYRFGRERYECNRCGATS
jgi:hypothetical protein